jgi:tetratricopeptide (TPR) repeat protein
MNGNGTKSYFDADEIADLLDYFESEDDIAQYEKILDFGLRLHPENPDLKIRICRLLIFKEQYDEALEMIIRTGHDDEGELELLKIDCLCALDRYDEVLSMIERKQMQPDESPEELYEYVASILSEMGDRQDELEELVCEGLALFPDNQTLKEEYCYILESQGLVDNALCICDELIDRDPYFADYWYMAGRLYAEADNYNRAIKSLNMALTCNDSDMEIKLFRAFCFYRNGSLAEAVREFQEIFSAVEKEGVEELIQDIAAEYPVPDDFNDVCTFFKILRDDAKNENVLSYLMEQFICEHDKHETPATITRHLDSIIDCIKQSCEDDEEKDDIHFMHAENICHAENRNMLSGQLASAYLTQKYHNN